MKLLDLHEILICMILSFYISEPEDLIVLREIKNRMIYHHLKNVKNVISATVASKIFSIHAKMFPELKGLITVPSGIPILIDDKFKYEAKLCEYFLHQNFKRLVFDASFKNYVKYLTFADKSGSYAHVGRLIAVAILSSNDEFSFHYYFSRIYYHQIIYRYLKMRYIKNWKEPAVDEVLEHVFELRKDFYKRIGNNLKRFGIRKYEDIDPIFFEPFRKWTLKQIATNLRLVLIKCFYNYHPKSIHVLGSLANIPENNTDLVWYFYEPGRKNIDLEKLFLSIQISLEVTGIKILKCVYVGSIAFIYLNLINPLNFNINFIGNCFVFEPILFVFFVQLLVTFLFNMNLNREIEQHFHNSIKND